MNRKVISIICVLFLMVAFQSCASKPEQTILKRYFDAVSLKDTTTMSTMALEPLSIDFDSWKIVSISEEILEPFKLPEMDKKEQELKKKVEESVGITLDARDALDEAKFELENARTRSARRAAKQKVDEMQQKYDEQYEKHKNLQKEYNEAKAAAAREEEIATFSLGAGELPTIITFTGEVRYKTVEISVKEKSGENKTYRFHLRKYDLTDESLGRHYRGRWIIERIEEVS